jgi:tetratricopeptide (TPR) repeat protein
VRSFSIRELEEKYAIHPRVVSELVKAGFVSPQRGKQREYRFLFQDVITLRMAQDLRSAGIPARQTARFLKQLQKESPRTSAARLRLSVHGKDLVVRDGYALRNPRGQLVLDFTGSRADNVRPLVRDQKPEPAFHSSADDWYRAALHAEASDPLKALDCYREAIDADPRHAEAYINLGCLLVEGQQWLEARVIGQEAVRRCPQVALLHYNLGVVHEELNEARLAIACYERAIQLDSKLADAHYNLAMLYEAAGRDAPAIRHLREYRKLT